jgi:hypothetical protein
MQLPLYYLLAVALVFAGGLVTLAFLFWPRKYSLDGLLLAISALVCGSGLFFTVRAIYIGTNTDVHYLAAGGHVLAIITVAAALCYGSMAADSCIRRGYAQKRDLAAAAWCALQSLCMVAAFVLSVIGIYHIEFQGRESKPILAAGALVFVSLTLTGLLFLLSMGMDTVVERIKWWRQSRRR